MIVALAEVFSTISDFFCPNFFLFISSWESYRASFHLLPAGSEIGGP